MVLSHKRINAIKRRVNNIISNCNCNNPFEIAAQYGIDVQFIEIADANIHAYSNCKTDTIYIDKHFRMNSYTARILCAHELGHIFLHNGVAAMEYNQYVDIEITDETIQEYEANIFAVMLMPQIAAGNNVLNYRPEKLNRFINDKII